LANLTFGMNNYGRMKFLIEMYEVIKKEKTLQQSMKTYPEKMY